MFYRPSILAFFVLTKFAFVSLIVSKCPEVTFSQQKRGHLTARWRETAPTIQSFRPCGADWLPLPGSLINMLALHQIDIAMLAQTGHAVLTQLANQGIDTQIVQAIVTQSGLDPHPLE